MTAANDITLEQLAFMSGAEPAKDIHVVLPLLQAGLMKTNPNAPPMFLRTPAGEALLREYGYQAVSRRVCVEFTIPASATDGEEQAISPHRGKD